MFVGRVVSRVWSTVKWPELSGLKLLLVQPMAHADMIAAQAKGGVPQTLEPSQDGVVVVDTLDAGPGDTVLVAFGHAARMAIAPELVEGALAAHPIDAAVVAVVDAMEVSDA
jgi:microcompartment protein CcmK/EutM